MKAVVIFIWFVKFFRINVLLSTASEQFWKDGVIMTHFRQTCVAAVFLDILTRELFPLAVFKPYSYFGKTYNLCNLQYI